MRYEVSISASHFIVIDGTAPVGQSASYLAM